MLLQQSSPGPSGTASPKLAPSPRTNVSPRLTGSPILSDGASSSNSPKLGSNSPSLGANSPKLGSNSPSLGANSPKLGTNSPNLGTNSPNLGASPKYGSPRIGGSPRVGRTAVEDEAALERLQTELKEGWTVHTGRDGRLYYCKLSEDLIQDLENELRPLLVLAKCKGRGLTTRCKILCTLSFLANGSYQKILGKNVAIYLSQASVSRCVREIVEAMNHPSIVKKYIRFPQNSSERQLITERFYEKFHIPGVIGCIDGTFVAMLRPRENEERYYCRKGFHARNIMLINDADLNILHVDASYGGATHDSFVFNHSIIRNHLEELTNSGEVVYLLGDAGYPQRSYLMTPVGGATEDTPEGHYNKLHATARNSIERTIGILKARFRCLLVHRVLQYHPDTVAKIVVACCVLHNICNRAGLPSPIINNEEVQTETSMLLEQHGDLHQESEHAIGRNSRINLINRLWQGRGQNR